MKLTYDKPLAMIRITVEGLKKEKNQQLISVPCYIFIQLPIFDRKPIERLLNI